MKVDYKAEPEFADALTPKQKAKPVLDMVDDLTHLPMGSFYERVQKADAVHHDSRTYGQMPKLWRQYGGKDLGETVCERVISGANNVRHAESVRHGDLGRTRAN